MVGYGTTMVVSTSVSGTVLEFPGENSFENFIGWQFW